MPGLWRSLPGLWTRLAERERDQLPLWLPVFFAAGIAAWFLLPWAGQRLALAVVLGGVALAGLAVRMRPLWIAALLALTGLAAAEWRCRDVAHPVLAARQTLDLAGVVEAVERRSGRDQVRFLLVPDATALPRRVRISIKGSGPPGLAPGARVTLRATLTPPAAASFPGGYDFARRAWFAGIGATGFPMGPVTIVAPPPPPSDALAWLADVRARLTLRIATQVRGDAGTIAAAFVTGDQGAIPQDTAQAMRDSGLAHLLSISGVHIAVVVGGTMWMIRRTLTLIPWLALRWPVKTIAVAGAAFAGIAYTILAGGEVPTVRSCLATLIVLVGILLGREAFSLRLLATGAFIIMALRPEALLGPSFQLSFAAVIGIVALYESPVGRWLTTPTEGEGWPRKFVRHGLSLLVSGMVAELTLSSIGLFHFNRAGLYGVFANLLAIPLTSFVIMPLLLLSLAADALGLGHFAYPAVGWSMRLLIGIADATAALPGSVVRSPAMPMLAYALIIAGGLWLALWRSRMRIAGAAVAALGLAIGGMAVPPDLIVSGDGRHAAIVQSDGSLAFLRERAGGYIRDMWGDATAATAQPALIDLPSARCTRDACVTDIARDGRRWRLLATLSRDRIDRPVFEPACAAADIVVSDRRMPRWCSPRWLKLDRAALGESGAVAVWFDGRRIETVHERLGDHPWRPRPPPLLQRQRGGPWTVVKNPSRTAQAQPVEADDETGASTSSA